MPVLNTYKGECFSCNRLNTVVIVGHTTEKQIIVCICKHCADKIIENVNKFEGTNLIESSVNDASN